MRHLIWIVILAMSLFLVSCNCGKDPLDSVVTAKNATPMPAKKVKAPPKPEALKKNLQATQKPGAAAGQVLSKEKLKEVMPDVLAAMKSDEFKTSMEQAVKTKDFKKLLMVILQTQKQVCDKHNIDFKDFVQTMNQMKDDPEMKKIYGEWKDAILAGKGDGPN